MIIRVVGIASMLIFCLTMRRICLSAGLVPAAKSWSTTLMLFGLFYVPGLAIAAFAPSPLFPESVPLRAGLGLVLGLATAVPLLHGLLSTAKMSLALPSMPAPRTRGGVE